MPKSGAMMSIGALGRATGLSVDTIRTWERRYGFPVPVRKPSGHRVYPATSVPRLRRVAQALAHGHRAGEVLRCSEDDLEALLAVAGTQPAPARLDPAARRDVESLLALVKRFDRDALMRTLNAEWARLGPLGFMNELLAPLVRAVGTAWETGRLDIRHEHFFSERVCDLLRAYRLPYEERARGPLLVFATLPGETHTIGLQMAALVAAFSGCRVCYIGPQTPVAELAPVARDLRARAVAVSISLATHGAQSSALLDNLRTALPKRIALVIGGEGAPMRPAGIRRFGTLPEFADWTAGITVAA
jgi:DNA-binding transcriptional MerR regulator/methylmalonyl-CoA mutase cobalamin-binding subunit